MKVAIVVACLLGLFAAINAQSDCFVSATAYSDSECSTPSPLVPEGCFEGQFTHLACNDIDVSGSTISLKFDCVKQEALLYLSAGCSGEATTVPGDECSAVFGGAAYMYPSWGVDCEGNPVADGGDDGDDGDDGSDEDGTTDGQDGSPAASLSAMLF
ncbi:DUF222 domain-containing protein [Balamuthia mandrillaris]